MFEDTKALLESTAEERDNTKRALDCTRTVLHKTESDKQKQMFLVKVICFRRPHLLFRHTNQDAIIQRFIQTKYFFYFQGLIPLTTIIL